MEAHDSICAIATPIGRAALGIIRVSGPKCRALAGEIFSRSSEIEARKAVLGTIRDQNSKVLDQVLLIFFEAPHSYTGEDMLELYCHGNPLILDRIQQLIVSRGTRLAEPGEFTRRALAYGKMSLREAESLDLVLNSTHLSSVELGLRGLGPQADQELSKFQEALREILMDLQAQLDFGEHEVGSLDSGALKSKIQDLINKAHRWKELFENQRPYMGRKKIILLGPPNSGKSSLFNALLGVDKAIVYDQPGTTRDILDSSWEFEGIQSQIFDTAGIREAAEAIEGLGIQKALDEAARADILIWVSDSGTEPDSRLQLQEGQALVKVLSKADLHPHLKKSDWISCSVFDPQSLQSLKKSLVSSNRNSSPPSSGFISSERQYRHLDSAIQRLQEAMKRLEAKESLEWVAQPVLESAQDLEELLGIIPHEEVLKSILSHFCIGK